LLYVLSLSPSLFSCYIVELNLHLILVLVLPVITATLPPFYLCLVYSARLYRVSSSGSFATIVCGCNTSVNKVFFVSDKRCPCCDKYGACLFAGRLNSALIIALRH
jgi:hypothetical protein